MRLLVKNEFGRYFCKKSLLGLFLSIPLMVLQAIKANQIVSIEQVTTFHTFALYMPLHKIFTFYLFTIPIILAGISIASEYENSEIRMILIRGYSSRQVFLVKLMMMIGSLVLFLLIYLICSYGIGFFIFPKEGQITSFLSQDVLSPIQCFGLTVKYYGFVFLILSVFTLGLSLVAITVRSVVTTTVIGMIFILAGFGYYMIIQLLQPYIPNLSVSSLSLWALPIMQLKGTYPIITGQQTVLYESLTILGIHLVGCLGLSYYVTGKQNQFI